MPQLAGTDMYTQWSHLFK